jgi:protocatechuate 3,4-dioxygenase beta subunit
VSRLIPVVISDRESEARTPARPLIVIPPEARDPFSAMPVLSSVAAHECDLTRIAPGRPQAAGDVIVIRGRILDADLRPVRHSLLEVWNANAHGRYSHSGDASSQAPLDPHFYGFGRVLTDDHGFYALRTIKPGAYMARSDIGWWRPPHVHFSILGGGVRLVTQMYFPDEPLNTQDYIHMIIPESERSRAIAQVHDEHSFHFDIIVRGRYQTPLETVA